MQGAIPQVVAGKILEGVTRQEGVAATIPQVAEESIPEGASEGGAASCSFSAERTRSSPSEACGCGTTAGGMGCVRGGGVRMRRGVARPLSGFEELSP